MQFHSIRSLLGPVLGRIDILDCYFSAAFLSDFAAEFFRLIFV